MHPGILTALLALTAGAAADDAKLERYSATQKQMGVPFTITVYAGDEDVANEAVEAAFQRIKQLNSILSDYEPDSELMQLCRTAGKGERVPVSEDLWKVLARADEISRLSNGAFDVSVGPLVQLWRISRRKRELPPPEALASARKLVDYRQIHLDPEHRTVELKLAGMRLDLGGIAKGYATDEALKVLRQRGFPRALIGGYGDFSVGDPPPDRAGWRIGIAPLTAPDAEPSEFIVVKNCGVATSGDAWQFVEIAGQRYSHIVDTRTGLGVTQRSSSTVIAPDGMTADALATAVSVLGPERGRDLVEKVDGAAAMIVWLEDGEPKTMRSKRMDKFLVEKTDAADQ